VEVVFALANASFNNSPAGPAVTATGGAGLGLLLRTHLRQTWRRIKATREQSRLLSSLILFFVFGYCAVSFYFFRLGLRFLGTFPGLGPVLIERLMYLLFAFLFLLLLFSNVVINYSNLFRNRETAFLLSTPMPAVVVFQWKFIESTLLASWAFLFLAAPLLGAFGLTRNAGWGFYAMTALVTGLFIVLPGVAGAWLAVVFARYLDRRLFQVVAVVTALGLLATAAFFLRPGANPEDIQETRVVAVLDRLLVKTHFALFPFLPSYWLSSSILQWADGASLAGGFFLLVLLSHVLFFGFLAFTRMGNFFYDSYSATQSRSGILAGWRGFFRTRAASPDPVRRVSRFEKAADLFWFIPQDQRAIMVKDARMFWRDTTQWGQTLILFGLLGSYILNLRHFSQRLTNPFWIHLVSYLNLGACSLNLATLTTRFVFPQFSLEGKRLWIVGMAPLGLAKVVRAKLQMACGFALVLTVGLILLSCRMLKLGWGHTIYLSGAIAVISVTLTSLAVGLGALYPNFKEENPGKIVSGFGGTFCLVLSFVYIVAAVVTLAATSPWRPSGHLEWTWTAVGWAGFAALSWLMGWLPCRLGLRRAATFEM
jgi:ABC-2 type transport system permease protein